MKKTEKKFDKRVYSILFLFLFSLTFTSAVIETWKYNYLPEKDETDSSTTYFPTSIELINGNNATPLNLSFITTAYDGKNITIEEVSGADPIDIKFNFTDVTDFDFGATIVWYEGSTSHTIEICLWNYVTSDWDCNWEITDNDNLELVSGTVFNSERYIKDGTVQLRYHHMQSGNPSHELYIDYISISSGGAVLISNDHNSLSDRDNILVNHPNIIDVFYTETESDSLFYSITNPWNFYNSTTLTTPNLSSVLAESGNAEDQNMTNISYLQTNNAGNVDVPNITGTAVLSKVYGYQEYDYTAGLDNSYQVYGALTNVSGGLVYSPNYLQSNNVVTLGDSSYYDWDVNVNVTNPEDFEKIKIIADFHGYYFPTVDNSYLTTNFSGQAEWLATTYNIDDGNVTTPSSTLMNEISGTYAELGYLGADAANIDSITNVDLTSDSIDVGNLDVSGSFEAGSAGFDGTYAVSASKDQIQLGIVGSAPRIYFSDAGTSGSLGYTGGSLQRDFILNVHGTNVFSAGTVNPMFFRDSSNRRFHLDLDGDSRMTDDTNFTFGVDFNPTFDTEQLGVFSGHLGLLRDQVHLKIGEGRDLDIFHDGTNHIFNSTNGGLFVFEGANISIDGLIYNSEIDNSSDALEWFKDGTNYVNSDGSINHSYFGECMVEQQMVDYSKPEVVNECYQPDNYTELRDVEIYGTKGNLRKVVQKEVVIQPDLVCEDRIYYPHTKIKEGYLAECVSAKTTQAMALINEKFDLEEEVVVINNSVLAEHYITNTTKDPATLTKVENFYNSLSSKSYQDMKDLVLTQEGKLSDNVLFNYEKSNIGSYNLEAIGHTNRAMNVLMMWKISQLENKQQQQLNCWDLTTQQQIVSCMRNI